MAWPPQFLDELIDRTDLVDLVGESVRLTKKGNSYWGWSPTGRFTNASAAAREAAPSTL